MAERNNARPQTSLMAIDTRIDTVLDTVIDTLRDTKPDTRKGTPYRYSDIQSSTKRRQSLALRAFMSHTTKALCKKCGKLGLVPTVRACFREVVAYLKDYPEDQPAVSEAVDFLPQGMPHGWYPQAVRSIIQVRTHEKLKAMTKGGVKG